MTEDEARNWVRDRFGVPRETLLDRFVTMLRDEATHQNLVSANSLGAVWARHITESAQLIPMAASNPGHWVDIGTGAGFPGIVIAALTDRDVTLIEPRRKRADFLERVVAALDLEPRVAVQCCRAEQCAMTGAVISARAVAALPALLDSAAHLSTKKSLWLLPKGRSAAEEVAAARQTWHGVFHVEQSITDPHSLIITAKGVARR